MDATPHTYFLIPPFVQGDILTVCSIQLGKGGWQTALEFQQCPGQAWDVHRFRPANLINQAQQQMQQQLKGCNKYYPSNAAQQGFAIPAPVVADTEPSPEEKARQARLDLRKFLHGV